MEIYSEKQTISVGLNETKEVDLDGDGKTDVRISLLKIYDDLVKVDLKIEEIEKNSLGEVAGEVEDSVEENGKNYSWIWWIGGLLVVVLVLGIVFWKKKFLDLIKRI